MLKKYIAVAAVFLSITNNAIANTDESFLENYNRFMFGINYQVDKYTLKPLAKGYRFITTSGIRSSVSDAFSNVTEPVSAANYLLQGKFVKSANSLGRFVVNSTLGLAGFFDVAQGWGLEKDKTNFDETMSGWCVPDGPFFIIPFMGPSTPRAIVGFSVDGFGNPIYLATRHQATVVDKVAFAYSALYMVSAREQALDFLDEFEKNSVDYYTAIRSAFIQNRQQLNAKCPSSNSVEKPSYDFDFEVEEDSEF